MLLHSHTNDVVLSEMEDVEASFHPLTNNVLEYDMAEIIIEQIPPTRQSAKECGSKYYFTGMECKNGHISKRYTKHRTCFLCLKEKNQSNKVKTYLKEYRSLNKEKIAKLARNFFLKDKPLYYKKQKQYREKNIEKTRSLSRKRMKEWRKENPEAARALKVTRRVVHSKVYKEDILLLLKKQKYKCINCKCCVKNEYHIDHINPIKRGGGNEIENLQVLCPTCNKRKSAKDPVDWARENGRLL